MDNISIPPYNSQTIDKDIETLFNTKQRDKLTQSIMKHEGFRGIVYKDSLGYKTIGWGHKCTDKDHYQEGHTYSKNELGQTLDKDINTAIKGTIQLFQQENIKILAADAVLVITEMVFQMGETGVGKFKTMFEFLKKSEYKLAATDMLSSKWAKQTHKRAQNLALEMQSCANSSKSE
jgi:lysozyme